MNRKSTGHRSRVSDKDVWRAAQAMIKLHGNDGLAYAETRAEQFASQGADDGAAVWRRCAVAIGQLNKAESGVALI